MGRAAALFPDPSSYERMSGLDASFLHAETDRTPLHLGSLSVFEGWPFFDERGTFRLADVQDRVAERLHLVPRFRKRVVDVPLGQGRPMWVDDDAFDVRHHVRLTALPEPGSRRQLAALCCDLHMRRLDRARPLWELWFVDGLDDGNVAMIEKVHHAMVDGVAGVELATALLDPEPEVAPVDAPPWRPVPAPSSAALLLDSARERLAGPARWAWATRSALHGPGDLLRRVAGLTGALRSVAPLSLPTSLNRPVGHHRELTSVTVDLDAVRAAGHRAGATVNDLVLAAVAGGLREVLAARGEHPGRAAVHGLVPVSMRVRDQPVVQGNQVSGIILRLPVDEPTPAGRLAGVRDAMARRKHRGDAEGTELVVDGLDLLPPTVLRLAVRSVHRQPFIDLVVTNVPGPAAPLYFLGARMIEAVPIVPLAGNLSLGIAVLSYDGRLTLGFYAERDLWPDLDVLTRGVRADIDAQLATSGPGATTS